MPYPNTKHSNLIIFWFLVSLFISLFGITVANLSNISPGVHPIIEQIQKIITSDKPFLGVILSFISFVFVGYILFSVWVMLSFVIFSILSLFDEDIKKNIHFMLRPSENSDSKLSVRELSDLSLKIIVFTLISSGVSFVLLSLLYSWVSM